MTTKEKKKKIKVWDRTKEESEFDHYSYPAFMVLITIWTTIAIFTTTVVGFIAPDITANSDGTIIWSGLIGLIVVIFTGIAIVQSKKPLASFLGLMMISVGFGFLIVSAFAGTEVIDIMSVAIMTTVIVVICGIIGTIIPEDLSSWTPWILAGLLIAIVGQFLLIPLAAIFGANIETALGIWDWAIIALFFFITAYDFNRARKVARTLDNSIDIGVAIYLDWFNIFIRLLRRK